MESSQYEDEHEESEWFQADQADSAGSREKSRAHGQSDNPAQDYLNKISKIPVLSECAELELLKRAELHEQPAIDKLIWSNLRLAAKVAIRYSNCCSLEVLDLIQEGNRGLFRAIDKFKTSYGTKFSTYAIWWIRQSITRAIANQSRTVRVPAQVHGWIGKVIQTRSSMSNELGRAPTTEEIAKKLEQSAAAVEKALRLSQQTISIDSPAGSEGDACIGDFISGNTSREPEAAARKHLLRESILLALDDLSESEQAVIKYRFGLYDDRQWTLEEIGVKFGVTRERIRQIESKALVRMRHPSRSRFLREFYDLE